MNFKGITPEKIIAHVKKKEKDFYYTRRPEEYIKTAYQYGQTIILKGCKAQYEGIIDFWLAAQAWYSDGEDTFYNELLYDDICSYSTWYEDAHRLGICKLAVGAEQTNFDRIISSKFKEGQFSEYLIMDPSWNNAKVLFVDEDNYYLYFFWTGE